MNILVMILILTYMMVGFEINEFKDIVDDLVTNDTEYDYGTGDIDRRRRERPKHTLDAPSDISMKQSIDDDAYLERVRAIEGDHQVVTSHRYASTDPDLDCRIFLYI